MTNNEFRNILNDEENLLSKEELDLLINAELAKPEEEVDTELIDYCLKANYTNMAGSIYYKGIVNNSSIKSVNHWATYEHKKLG